MPYKIGVLATHPIQYYVPWYQSLAAHPEFDLQVFYCHYPTKEEQGKAGFGIAFEWDIPLLEKYAYQFLQNHSRTPSLSNFWGCNSPQLNQLIQREKFDAFIIHGWHVQSYWQAMWACWQTHTPILVRGDSHLLTQRSIVKRSLKFPFYRWFIPKFAAYLSVGKRATEYYLHYGADKDRIHFVPHAVDNTFFTLHTDIYKEKKNILCKQWKIPDDSIVFLFVGKLLARKRPEDFLRAVKIASKNHSKIFGLIVGDGPLRSQLERLVYDMEIPVTFSGFLNQTEISQAYAVCDVLVLPSDETWGLVVNEAMASGRPAIVSDQVGCAPDLIHPNKTGMIFPCGNVEELARLIRTIALDKDLLSAMSKNAFTHIQNYSIERATEGTMRAIQNINYNFSALGSNR